MTVARTIAHWVRVPTAVAFAVLCGACGDTDDAAGVPPNTAQVTATASSTVPATTLSLAGISTAATTAAPTSTSPAGSTPTTAATPTSIGPAESTPPSTIPLGHLDGVMVSPGVAQTPNDLWWAVDLVDGATVDGSTRVVVEVVRDEFGCGDSMRAIDWAQVQPGASVSFEVVADPPDERPPYWYRLGDQTLDSEPALRVRQFRVDCPPGAEEAAATLAENRVLWEQNGPQSYEFTLTIGVFGPWNGRYDVTVTDGGVTSVVRLDEGTDPVMADMPATVDAIFDLLQRQVTGDSFTALYHHSLGYPMSVSIDSIAGAVDDEFYVGIDSLTPIG